MMAHRTIVITGTDTGVGKTCGGTGLARALTLRGYRVIAIKPIESGCREAVSPDEDGVLLAGATGQSEPTAALLRLYAAVAPPVAADMEVIPIDMDALVDRML